MTQQNAPLYIGTIVTVKGKEYVLTGVHARHDFFHAKEFGREFKTIVAFDEINTALIVIK